MNSNNRGILKLRRLIIIFTVIVCALCFPCLAMGKTAGSIKIEGSHYVAKGKKITLKANKKVTWKTSNKKIATVSPKGVVKGLRQGKVTITATLRSKKSLTRKWSVSVTKKPAASVRIKAPVTQLDLKQKKTVKLTAKMLPSSALQKVAWKSSNPTVAKVSSTGKVTALKPRRSHI